MKYFFLLFFAFVSLFASAQDYVKHKVAKSETVTQIAKKYSVTPFDIIRLNPDAQNGVKENDVLLIPKKVLGSKPQAKPRTHLVEQGETFYAIARKYDVNVKDLEKVNADMVKDGLKAGQIVSIPGGTVDVKHEIPSEAKPSENKTPAPTADSHIVLAGETKYSIAKKYNISVADLEKQNPSIASGLQTGATLQIKGTPTTTERVVERPKPRVQEIVVPGKVETEVVKKTGKAGYANYEVKAGETLFGLAKSFNVSEEQLLELNPTLKDGVKTGMILKVPGKGTIEVEARKDYTDLTKVAKGGDRRKLVLLLPFNAMKISADTTKASAEKLKKDSFLNMTLDFYSGALMAIDSAKTLGLNVDVKIFDSEESKASSKVVDLIKSKDIKNADAVIGPFYQQHAERAAEELTASNVAVISPLSKEAGKKFGNLYQAMPSEQYTKKMMLDFLTSKGANVIIVSDPKRNSTKELISQSGYQGVKLAEVDASGSVPADKLRALLSKDQQNYIVLDTEKTGMILGTTNLLLAEVSNYKIQIVILEPNDTLDFEEISMKRLTVLKLLYPSMTRDNDSPAAQNFRNSYKEKNRVFPNQFATRGFDVTFDTLLRLSQGKTFAESAAEQKTEQVESKFDYGAKEGGFVNKGIYILQYNEDLSVKEVE
ncbi:LysM peptidoglycan-binding domain-containing protein [Flavobacterium sp.]|uniref:PBP1 and LysM peptidoglycan-binding domain-containing protein n=1 Tax=Flavobacterium sp. TaxID=239 RepID=UPI0025BE6717|nr:LysM peptidoglycan-binding domain-containing protein [Flavobacterium sp.]